MTIKSNITVKLMAASKIRISLSDFTTLIRAIGDKRFDPIVLFFSIGKHF